MSQDTTLNHTGEISAEEIQNSATMVVLDIPEKSSSNSNNNNNSGGSLAEEAAATRIQATFRGYIVRKSAKSDTDSVFLRDEKDELSTVAIHLEPATPMLDKTMHSYIVSTAINNAVEKVEEAQAREKAAKEESTPVIDQEEPSQQEEGENVSEHQQQPDKDCTENDEVLWTSPAFTTAVEDTKQCTEDLQDKLKEPMDEKSDPDPQEHHISNAHSSDEVESIRKDEDSSQKKDSNSLSNQKEDGTNRSGSSQDEGKGGDSIEQKEIEVESSSTQEDGQESIEVEPAAKITINDGPECTTEVENTTDVIESGQGLPEIEPTKGTTEESSQLQDTTDVETTKVDGAMEAIPGASQEESSA